MNDLRPIGDEFDYCYPPSGSSTDTSFVVFRYRVKGHAEVAFGFSGTDTDFMEGRGKTFGSKMAATLDVVDMKKYQPTSYVLWMGQLRPVPPPECAALLDAGWQALAHAVNGQLTPQKD